MTLKTLYRQDGSAVELTDEDAEQWIKSGLATPSVAAPAKPVEPKAPATRIFGKAIPDETNTDQ